MIILRQISRLVCMILVFAVFVAGCQHNGSKGGRTFKGTPVCDNNRFLKKYNCSVDRIQAAAQNGDPDAQYALGYMYFYGVGAPRDLNAAQLWIHRSAAQGQSLALKAEHILKHKEYPGSGESYSSEGKQKKYREYTAEEFNNVTLQRKLKQHTSQYKEKKVLARQQVSLGTQKQQSQLSNTLNRRPKLPAKSTAASMHNQFTIQLMSGTDLSVLSQFVVSHHLQTKASYYFTNVHGNKYYKLLYGKYVSIDEAQAALKSLPKNLKAMHPWIKSFSLIKKELGAEETVA